MMALNLEAIRAELPENRFHLGDILTITTGVLLSPFKEAGVFALLSYMVDEDVNEINVSRIVEECKPALLNQFPDFSVVGEDIVSKITPENWMEVLNHLCEEFGGWHDVEKLDPALHVKIDIKEEAKMLAKEYGFEDEVNAYVSTRQNQDKEYAENSQDDN